MHSKKTIAIPRFRTDYGTYNCPVKNAASLLGDKWILFILREFFYGKKKQGFNELLGYLNPISSRTLAKKLALLRQLNILHKEILSKKPPKVEYSLTNSPNLV